MDRIIEIADKPSGYKLVKSKLILGQEDLIKDIKITGDFFCIPNESIKKLENFLKKTNVKKIETNINKFIEKNEIQIAGLNVNSLSQKIIKKIN